MKKLLIISFFALLFMACKKDQTLLDGLKPEERASKELEHYNNELTQSPNGWVAYLSTTTVKGTYGFYINFKQDNVLKIRADFDDNSLSNELTGTYRLKKVMATTLIFDTDSYVNVLLDPTAPKGGEKGLGFGSDAEFEIQEQVADTITLIGKRRGALLKLVKATVADKDFYTQGGAKEIMDYIGANPFLYILDEQDPNKKIEVSFKLAIADRSVALSSLEQNGTMTSVKQSFGFVTPAPNIKNNPLVFGVQTITGFEWDKANKKLFAITASKKKTEVFVSATPITPLYFLIGTKYTTVTVPRQATYPGWGSDFVSKRARAASNIYNGGYSLRLLEIQFQFNAGSQKLMLKVGLTQDVGGQYNTNYSYSYTKTANGIFKFTVDPNYKDSFWQYIGKGIAPLLDDRINTDTFTVDYLNDPTSKTLLAQFKSIEHPDFIFTGTL